MIKKLYKKTLGHKIFLGFIIGVIVVVCTVLLMLTPIGGGVIKKFIEMKIDKYIPGAEVTYLDYGVNNFSLALKKGHNIIKIYGEMFPLNAMYEGNIENLSEFSPYYQGKVALSGKLYTNKDKIIVEGMSFFANGYMNFKVALDDSVALDARGSDFDLPKILYMVKINYPWVDGKTDLFISKQKDGIFHIVAKTSGEYKRTLATGFKAVTEINMKHRNNLRFSSKISSGIGYFSISGISDDNRWKYSFTAEKIKLSKLKPVLLYPLHNTVDFQGSYDSSNDVLKFKGNGFEGFYDTKIELTFKMDARRFFSYIGMLQLLNGEISGTVKINDKFGTFDIVSNNTQFLNNWLIKRVYYLTGVDLSKEKTGKVFFKGYFDKNQAVFDMLSTNQNISISVKKGKFIYPDKYDMVIYLRKGNNVFKMLLKNGKIKMLEKRDFRERDNKILVF